jgi:serine-type D-Ala-D-Ala carboxypeptidase/endopeptidase (penicillin-binding protein 4)
MLFSNRTALALASLLTVGGTWAFQAPIQGVQGEAAAPTPAPPAVAAAPQPVSREVAEVRADLERTISASGWRGAQWGVIAVSLDRGDTIFSLNPDLPLAPASNMKLFSTAAALYYLGPDFRYSTYVLADGPVEGGVLQGDVILYGTGDPAISARMLGRSLNALEELADSLVARGVREVTGDVVGDGSYFDDRYLGEGWSPTYRLASYSAPVGALSFAENLVNIRVLPGAVGGPAQFRTVPATSGLALHNEVRTVAGGTTRVRFDHDERGMVISGQIARGHGGVNRVIPVVDPTNFAAAAFRAVLEERGLVVHGGVRSISRPEHSRVGGNGRAAAAGNGGRAAPRVLGVHLSPTMLELTNVTNQISQNLYAEALLKTVGRVVIGEGSAAAGARAVEYMLECESGFAEGPLQIADGSGLSRLNQVTPRATLHLLDYMARSEFSEQFDSTLPVAAAPGDLRHSLRNRLGMTPAARNLRAKTGTINRVSSLAGYVNSASGERIAFVIYVNETPSTAIAKRIEDAIGIRLARFDRPPLPSAQLAQTEDAAPDGADPAPPADEPSGPAGDTGSQAQAAPAATAGSAPPRSAAAAPRAEPRTHTIRQGETLDAISRRHGTTVAELQRLNPGLNPRRLQLGQRVRIPDG